MSDLSGRTTVVVGRTLTISIWDSEESMHGLDGFRDSGEWFQSDNAS